METTMKNTEIKELKSTDSEKNFIEEYNEIFNKTENHVVVKNQWASKGDYFEKLTIYDNSYSTIQTFSYTSIIK